MLERRIIGTTTTDENMAATVDTTPEAIERRAALRITAREPRDLFGRVVAWMAKRVYGDVPDNVLVLLGHRPALRALIGFERRIAKLDRLDADLRALAVTASAASIGCSWCLDVSYYLAWSRGNDVRKVREVPRWRESDRYTQTERTVLEYAEAMTSTPPAVTDDMVQALVNALGEEAVVELTMMIAVENQRSRFNAAFGLTSQGFSRQCEVSGA